jgi:hypothetical protein
MEKLKNLCTKIFKDKMNISNSVLDYIDEQKTPAAKNAYGLIHMLSRGVDVPTWVLCECAIKDCKKERSHGESEE